MREPVLSFVSRLSFLCLQKPDTSLFLPPPRMCLTGLFVWLIGGWHKNYWTDFNETKWQMGHEPRNSPFKFRVDLDKGAHLQFFKSLSLTLWDKEKCMDLEKIMRELISICLYLCLVKNKCHVISEVSSMLVLYVVLIQCANISLEIII